jgi:hypothetical protein
LLGDAHSSPSRSRPRGPEPGRSVWTAAGLVRAAQGTSGSARPASAAPPCTRPPPRGERGLGAARRGSCLESPAQATGGTEKPSGARRDGAIVPSFLWLAWEPRAAWAPDPGRTLGSVSTPSPPRSPRVQKDLTVVFPLLNTSRYGLDPHCRRNQSP